MVSSMFVCVPFVKGLKNGTYRYYWTGVVIQHIWQTMFLGMAVWWGAYRQWYWVQAGFLVLRECRILKEQTVGPTDMLPILLYRCAI